MNSPKEESPKGNENDLGVLITLLERFIEGWKALGKLTESLTEQGIGCSPLASPVSQSFCVPRYRPDARERRCTHCHGQSPS